jgi:putative tryptophan/tyrosine transport system substrate-binding protein
MQFGQLERRDFVMLLGGAVAWPLAAPAQPPGKLPTVGFIVPDTLTAERQRITAFLRRLSELGWTERRNIAIEFRTAEGHSERLRGLANELVGLNVDLIVSYSTPAIAAAKQATSLIPIVFAAAGDPVGTGLVVSLARPGGNVTGLSLQQRDLGGKRLGLLREALPGLHRFAIMADADNPFAALEIDEVESAAQTLGLDVVKAEIRSANDVAPAFAALKGHVEALYMVATPLMNTNRIRINTWALAARLPTIYSTRENVEVGGLISYGPSFLDLFRRAADIADKILHGAKPGDIPVEQPTKFELVVNLITAQALGLEIPPTVLARADEVIE